MVALKKKRRSAKKRTVRKSRARRTLRRATRTNPARKKTAKKRSTAKKTVSRGTTTASGVKIVRPRLRKKGSKFYASRHPRGMIAVGTRINPKRKRRSRRVRRNPALSLKQAFSQKMLFSTAKAGAGIAIGFAAMPIFYRILPAQLKDQRRWLGGIHVMLGLSIAGLLKNRHAKDIGLVIAATGVYDLIAMNVDFLGLPPLRTSSMLADKLMPEPQAAIPAPAEQGVEGYYGASYPVAAAPVSRVAARGYGANYQLGASYASTAYPTVGLSGDGGADIDWDGMIN